MGPMHQQWQRKGTIGQMFPSATFQGATNYLQLRLLIGSADFYQLYVFKSYNAGADVYVRRGGARPIDRFWHYHLDVEDPDFWWASMSSRFVGMVTQPEWRDGLAAIIDGGFDRSRL